MIREFFLSGLSLFFCACNSESGLPDTDMSVKLLVQIGSNPLSRTVTETDGSVSFYDEDKVGMFVENVENPVLWTYRNNIWEAEKNVEWENRSDDFEFLAYYPCSQTEGVIRTSVPMPDLAVQTGNIDDIGEKDFLVGRCVTSYSANNGVVSFAGENAFTHVFSLLHLNIINEDQSQSFIMESCTFSGEGIVTPYVYSFDSSSSGMIKAGTEEVSELQIDDLSSLSSITVLINPVVMEEPLRFTLRYTVDGKKYEASANLVKNFTAGSFNKLTLRLVDGELSMTGNEVLDWNVIMLEDIVLIGTSM